MPTSRDRCSLCFSAAQAAEVFPGSQPYALVLALLAGIQPRPDWEGSLVFQAEGPPEQVRVGLSGPRALAIRDRVVESIARVGIELLACEEHDALAMAAPIARVEDGAWR